MRELKQLNFGINRDQCGASSAQCQDSERRGMREPPPVVTFQKGWQIERVQRLTRIFRCVDRGLARGKRMHKMLVNHAWRWRDRHYKTDPARRIHFRYSTLVRLYYTWRAGGKTPAALALRYRRANWKATRGQVVELSKLCLAPETVSFSAAYRRLKAPGVTESAYRYATPTRLRAALAALLAHRRHEQVLERAARRLLKELAE